MVVALLLLTFLPVRALCPFHQFVLISYTILYELAVYQLYRGH